MRRVRILLLGIMALALLSAAFHRRGVEDSVFRAIPLDRGVAYRDGRAFIDINSADKALLEGAPGLGGLYEEVMAMREALGGFGDVSELGTISGIGSARLKTIAEWALAG